MLVHFALAFLLGALTLYLVRSIYNYLTRRNVKFRCKKRLDIFSREERVFLALLDLAVTDQYRVFSKVRVGDIVTPYRCSSRAANDVANDLLSSHCFDFILCHKYKLTLIAVVTLEDNDTRKKRKTAKKNTQVISSICNDAGIPHVKFSASVRYLPSEIANTLRHHRIKLSDERPKSATNKPRRKKPARLK
ncbi:DUF2726 domain-containing protein [Veronia pacifica]